MNPSYYKDRTREWISVSGIAALTRDREKIDELYAPDWKAWFPNAGDSRHGTKDDPRMVLIGVDVHTAVFLEVSKPQAVVLFEVVKGMVTGSTPEIVRKTSTAVNQFPRAYSTHHHRIRKVAEIDANRTI